MVEGRKYVVIAQDVYEILLIKAETTVNPTASNIKQTQENLNTVWNRVGISEEEKFQLHTEELNKLRKGKDEINATPHPLQKALIDKVKEEKMDFKSTFTQNLPVTPRSRRQLVLNYLKQYSNIISWNEQGQMIYKDDVIENSNMIDLLTCMTKLKSNNANQISPFVNSLFVKAIVECDVSLEWIKNKDMLTMVKMVKEMENSCMILS